LQDQKSDLCSVASELVSGVLSVAHKVRRYMEHERDDGTSKVQEQKRNLSSVASELVSDGLSVAHKVRRYMEHADET
jgi:hypothetical protein